MRAACYLLILCGVICSSPATAQKTVSPLNREYLDSTWAVLPTSIGAHYQRETEYTDSVSGVVRTYFINGQIQSSYAYENLRKKIAHGTHETWFPNSQLRLHEEFEHGEQVGELRTHYMNGQLKRREAMGSNSGSTGECFLADGQQVPFFAYQIMPVYSGGDGGFKTVVQAIQKNIVYPRDALKAGVGGRVVVSFTVNNYGWVANIRIVEGVSPSIDAAVVRAVQQLQRFRPGLQDGTPVSVSFSAPVTFSVNKNQFNGPKLFGVPLW